MRAVSLSNKEVITLLNSAFVPVFVSNEDYRDSGAAPPDERAILAASTEEEISASLAT